MANYSDDGKTLFSSYGHRWVNHFKQDQLKALIQHLKEDPNSRRAVLQMWDANSDLPVLLSNEGKDLSCNYAATLDPQPDGSIDLNVNNRSNDLIFGAYGANMVHFNVLHQYIAYALNRKKGVYRQISNNTHVYLEFPITKRFLDPATLNVTEDYYRDDPTLLSTTQCTAYHNQFDSSWDAWQANGQVADRLDDVITFLMSTRDELHTITEDDLPPDTPDFIRTVFVPMFLAFRLFKLVGAKEALRLLTECQLEYKSSSPWYKAGCEWLLRRIK
jgi:Thymidylate synthase